MRALTTLALRRRQRDLLADDRRQVGVEGQHERLELPRRSAMPLASGGMPTGVRERVGRAGAARTRWRRGSGRACRRCRRAGSRSRGPGRPGSSLSLSGGGSERHERRARRPAIDAAGRRCSAMPNMPTFWYTLRRCGTLKICGLALERRSGRRCRRSPGARRRRRCRRDRACGSRCSCGRASDGAASKKKSRPACCVGVERVVEVADRVRRIASPAG